MRFPMLKGAAIRVFCAYMTFMYRLLQGLYNILHPGDSGLSVGEILETYYDTQCQINFSLQFRFDILKVLHETFACMEGK